MILGAFTVTVTVTTPIQYCHFFVVAVVPSAVPASEILPHPRPIPHMNKTARHGNSSIPSQLCYMGNDKNGTNKTQNEKKQHQADYLHVLSPLGSIL